MPTNLSFKAARARVFVLVTCAAYEHGNDLPFNDFLVLSADIQRDTGEIVNLGPLQLLVKAASDMLLLSSNHLDIGVRADDPTYGMAKWDRLERFRRDMDTHAANLFPKNFVNQEQP